MHQQQALQQLSRGVPSDGGLNEPDGGDENNAEPIMGEPQSSASLAHIQRILDKNCALIQTITDFQNLGKVDECMVHHQLLDQNLVYLAKLIDTTQHHSPYMNEQFVGPQPGGPHSPPPMEPRQPQQEKEVKLGCDDKMIRRVRSI